MFKVRAGRNILIQYTSTVYRQRQKKNVAARFRVDAFAAIMLSTSLYISAAYLPVRERQDVKDLWWTYGKWLVLLGYLLAVVGIIMFGYVLLLIIIIRFPHQQQFIFGLVVYAAMWGIIGFLSVLLPLILTIYISRWTKTRVFPDTQEKPVG